MEEPLVKYLILNGKGYYENMKKSCEFLLEHENDLTKEFAEQLKINKLIFVTMLDIYITIEEAYNNDIKMGRIIIPTRGNEDD